MRSLTLCGLLFFATAFSVLAQNSAPAGTSTNSTSTATASKKQSDIYVRPDAKTREKDYISSIFGPVSIAKNVALAGYNTWRNSPEEWGPTWKGFGRRVASNFGQSAIKNSVQFGLDEALTVDSKFYRSKDKSVSARIGNALISPVTARKEDGSRTIGVPRIVGTYSAAIIARETWYPDRYSWKDGLKSGTISLGFTAGMNLIKEFIWK
jgi:hypothetical protein